MRVSILYATAAVMLAVPAHLFAAETVPADDIDLAAAAQSGTEIIVTGRVDGYRTEQTSSGTKTKTLLINLPQAVSVVTREQIDRSGDPIGG